MGKKGKDEGLGGLYPEAEVVFSSVVVVVLIITSYPSMNVIEKKMY